LTTVRRAKAGGVVGRCLAGLLCLAAAGAQAQTVTQGLDAPLTAVPGDAARGRALVADRATSLCLLCHRLPLPDPFPHARLQGTVAPDLSGAGRRWTAAQLRLRVIDSRRIDPAGVMPAFHRAEGLTRVGPAWRGKPILDAQQVEDVVAFLQTLTD
jgi:sulfur-oxidizing protein SoxX